MEIYHDIQKNTELTYIYRAYSEYGTLRYKFAMPISYRGAGMFEAHAWNSLRLLWPDVPTNAFSSALQWISHELKRIDGRYRFLIGTFEVERIALYERLFRNRFVLKIVNIVNKTFNGVSGWFVVVWFKELIGK